MGKTAVTPVRATRRVVLVASLAGTAAVLVGGVVLTGWALDLAALKSVLPGGVSMKPNAALAFILTGLALLEDYAGKLDNTAQHHLRRIRANSQHMAELIDDLLNLSQLTQAELQRQRVDLTAMAKEVGAELQQMNPGHVVELFVAPGLTADVDPRMVMMVMNNLLGNAWKFTGQCAQARIEVGAWREDGEDGFFVRDNGAGFDMAHVGKLFGAFQRLHSLQEFEGNGIGLALVRGIVHRHGGRVWAEGAVGQGATFYFTLGKKRN